MPTLNFSLSLPIITYYSKHVIVNYLQLMKSHYTFRLGTIE